MLLTSLTLKERRFLRAVEHLKYYLLALAVAVFLLILSIPPSEISLATCLVIVALCGLLWVTQRLLTFITLLDIQLAKAIRGLKYSLSDEQRRELLQQ